MKLEKVICPCKKVTQKEVLRAIAQGATSFQDIKRMTGAGSKCGKCEKDIRQFIKEVEQS